MTTQFQAWLKDYLKRTAITEKDLTESQRAFGEVCFEAGQAKRTAESAKLIDKQAEKMGELFANQTLEMQNTKQSTAKAIFDELDQFIINNQLFGEHKISVDTPIVITYFEIKRKYLKLTKRD